VPEGNALAFEGMFINYKRINMSADVFQTIQPGETVSASVNAAKTYKLQGVAKAKATAIQGFYYVEGTTAPTAIKDTSYCEVESSSSVDLTPNQDTVVA
jgi:deuterolysin